MVVKLTEIHKINRFSDDGRMKDSYTLRDIFVNPEHIVCLREDEMYKTLLLEGHLGELDKRQDFTRIYLNRGQSGIDLVVIGDPPAIQEKLGLSSSKQLLKG